MRGSTKLLVLLLGSMALAAACSDSGDGDGDGDGGTSGGSDCEKLCERAGSIDCADDDCVETCEDELPSCDDEFRDVISCSADAETLGCVNGKIAAEGCDAENAALLQCLTGGSGGSGGGGGGPSGTTCEKLCAKASDAGCEPADCVSQCGMTLPKCDVEYHAFNTCAADHGTITCASDGDPEVAGCDPEQQALSDCLLGGGGSCYDGHGDCDPLDPTTCAGQGCYLTDQDDFACFAPGTVPAGGACAGPEDCGPNLVCAEDSQGQTKCHTWCCDDNDCGAGSCVSYGAAGTIDVKLCAQ